MAGGTASSVNNIVLNEDRINKALALSLKAHRSPEKPYLVEKIRGSPSEVIFSFPGCGSVKDWYSETPFGESPINLTHFPSLKSVGNDEFSPPAMGWVWRNDDDDQQHASFLENRELGSSDTQSCGPCSTRKKMKSRCRTEEVEPGKFVRKCEKSQEILRDCIGKSVEVVESSREYTEDDVTEEVLQGGSSKSGSSDAGVFDLPGLRSDLEAMEKNVIDGLSRFFDAAEDVKNGFVDVIAKAQPIFDGPSAKPEASTKPKEHQHGAVDADLSALAKDV